MFNKLVPYDATEYGVGVGIKVVLEQAEWRVKSTKGGDVVIEHEGRLDKTIPVLSVLGRAAGVTTLEETQRIFFFVLFLCSIILIITIHLPKFVKINKKTHCRTNAFKEASERDQQVGRQGRY